MKKPAHEITQPARPEPAPGEDQNTPVQEQPTEQPQAEQSAAAAAAKPSPHLEGKFRIVGTEPGEVYTPTRHRTVDLRTITAEVAEELVASGRCQFLERIETPESAE